MPALWRAWQARPSRALQRRLESLGRKIVAWENETARALAVDPPDAAGRRRSTVPREVDLAALQACLRAQAFGAPDLVVTGLARLSGGFSRATWLLHVEDRASGPHSYVVRQQMQGGIVQGVAADVKHEYPLLRVLHAAGVPVPKPLLLVTGRNPLRQDFMVVTRLPGQAIGNSVGDSTIADAQLLESAAGALARLHTVDWTRHHAALRGSRTWHRSPNVGLRQLVIELLDRWHAYIRGNIGIASPSVETGMAWLRANVPDRVEAPRIVHGDVTFANMLAEHGRLTALLDWEVTCLGDPAKDLAHFKPVVESRMPWQSFMASYLAAGGRPVDEHTLRYYEVFKAVTHVAVNYVARGRRFARAPEARPELTEIGLLQLPVYMPQLHAALKG
jgi:aminoglycoside phosphotransferase (APT) family kinase protein